MIALPSQIRPARGSRISFHPHGRTVSLAAPSAGWKHPWFTEAKWNAKEKKWYAQMFAGFVNGFAPMVHTTAGAVRYARGAWFGQLVDAKSGADEIAQLALLAIEEDDIRDLSDDTPIKMPLYRNPPIALNAWRALGWDGDGRVPQYFLDRGVSKPTRILSDLAMMGPIPQDSLIPPKGNRLLRACDIILHQPRVALTSEIMISGGLVMQMLGTRPPTDDDQLRILSGNFDQMMEENSRSKPWENLNAIANNFEEAQADQLKIATVYLLSPPDVTDPEITGQWEPFVEHFLFWNLHWEQPRFENLATNLPITAAVASVKMLGSGAASVAIDYIANSIDMATNAAINLLRGTSLGGSFWTPTGGGTTTIDPRPPSEEEAKKSLDKSKNTAAKEKAKAQEKAARRLDPAFPYEGSPFNLSTL